MTFSPLENCHADPSTFDGQVRFCCAYYKKINEGLVNISFFFKIYLFIHSERAKREAETQAEGEAGSLQEAQYGTRSWVSRTTPQAARHAKPLGHRGCPVVPILEKVISR